MIKRWLSIVLLLILILLVFVYVMATSRLGASIYTDDQRRAFAVHERMNLSQAAPISKFYVESESGVLEAVDADKSSGVAAMMGAADCRVRATLDARYEEVEGVATTVYDLEFEGTYLLRYDGSIPTTMLELVFPFPQGLDTLNQVYFLVDGEEPADVRYSLDSIVWWTQMEVGEEHEVTVRYRARGVGSFSYTLDHNRRLEDLDVEIAVQGLVGSEVPNDFLPTTSVEDVEGEAGEKFAWRYEALIADRDVQVVLPARSSFVQRVEKLQEPLQALSRFSPLFIASFIACLFGAHRLSGTRLPIEHYLLTGLGFFLFYPALVFLSGVFELELAAAVALVLITALLTIFVGHATESRRIGWQTALLCGVFFGLFSMGMISHLRGLLFTVGGLLLVGMFMLLVARQRPPEPAIEEVASRESSASAGDEVDETAEPVKATPPEEQLTIVSPVEVNAPDIPVTIPEPPPPLPSRYCPHCGGPLNEAFAFCPACGRDAKPFHRCSACGTEHYVSSETELGHCPACGERMSESANGRIQESTNWGMGE